MIGRLATAGTTVPHRRRWSGIVFIAVMLPVAIVALATAVHGLDRPLLAHLARTGADPGLLLLNAIPGVLLALALLAATRRPLLSLWLAALALALLYDVSSLKAEHLATPLLPADFQMLGQLGAGGDLLGRYLPSDPGTLLRWLLVVVATAALAFEPAWAPLGKRTRVVLALASVVVFASLVQGIAPWPATYSRARLGFEAWSPVHSGQHGGLMASLLRYHWEFSTELAPPDRAAAEALMARYPAPAPTSATATPPDIIVLQSESFFDPARLRGMKPDEVIPNYRRLAARAEHGDLWVPTFGGGTIRTEFEVLTGIALRYFPDVQYPYFSLTRKPLPSLVRTLAGHGYRTLAVHPNVASFWNREAAFNAIDFDAFDSIRNFGPVKRSGYYASDASLVEHILSRLSDAGPPQFLFAISMESHGPYNASPGIDEHRRDAEPVTRGLSPPARRELQDYLYHLGDADRALGRLADALMARKRRTLLVFYGDHLPGLTEVYAKAGFDDGRSATEQPVPYLLLDSADPAARHVDSAAFFLAGQILASAGIDDRYFELTEAVRARTRFGPGFEPSGNAGLAAAMQLRQQGVLFAPTGSAATAAAGAPSTR
jgi:phosphoglycerol transferase MdoB-like AlkP superfamily enzyme